jgi:transcriptional regulator with XRE-family HTH domain
VTFAENLRTQRIQHFLSQGELAKRAGIHAGTITRLEVGITVPSMRTVRALAAALGIEPRDLADPREVAEVRRINTSSSARSKDRDRLGAWSDDGGAAVNEMTENLTQSSERRSN